MQWAEIKELLERIQSLYRETPQDVDERKRKEAEERQLRLQIDDKVKEWRLTVWDTSLQRRLTKDGPTRTVGSHTLVALWVAHNRHPNLVAVALKRLDTRQLGSPWVLAIQQVFKRHGWE